MITLAAVLGMLPIAMDHGLGSELRSGIGCASVGGILVSGLLTLFLLAVFYNLFTRSKPLKSE
jgi:multidrug efflux pump subunit AcrB